MSWARRSAIELERRRVEINALNVFPVADSDTGSNMAYTMSAAVKEADKLSPGASTADVAEALAVGSMRGARGNSGVVLSQVIRGVAHSIGDGGVTGRAVADALRAGVQFVDRAITNPVEGTVVTVLRAASDAADAVADEHITTVVQAACEAAREALRCTPSQLDVLRDAGVVDAGGTGLVILLEQLLHEVNGVPPEQLDTGNAPGEPAPTEQPGIHGAAAHLEVMFMFGGDLDALEATLIELGADSIVIARGSGTQGHVHAHSFRAGTVIESAFALGDVSDLRLEVLPDTAAPGDGVEGQQKRLIIALTPPGSLARLYAQAGAVAVTPGEDSGETSQAVCAALRESPATEILLLVNGLAADEVGRDVAKQASALGKTATILPTASLAAGIAALAVHDGAQPLSETAAAMEEAAREMRTAVAHCVAGQVKVSSRGYTSVAGPDATEAIAAAAAALLEPGGELVSILYDPQQLPELEAELNAPEMRARLDAELRMYPADGLGALAEIGVE